MSKIQIMEEPLIQKERKGLITYERLKISSHSNCGLCGYCVSSFGPYEVALRKPDMWEVQFFIHCIDVVCVQGHHPTV